MVLLVRIFLISFIIYLLFRSFARLFNNLEGERHEHEEEKIKNHVKGVPKEVGEYVDYEEVKK